MQKLAHAIGHKLPFAKFHTHKNLYICNICFTSHSWLKVYRFKSIPCFNTFIKCLQLIKFQNLANIQFIHCPFLVIYTREMKVGHSMHHYKMSNSRNAAIALFWLFIFPAMFNCCFSLRNSVHFSAMQILANLLKESIT